jgi:hypothetical protein
MKTLGQLFLLLSLFACGAETKPWVSSTASTAFRHEFTGDAAEEIIAAFERLGLKALPMTAEPIFGFNLSDIDCILVPSPRASAVCTLKQDTATFAAAQDSELIYQNFIKNGALFEGVNGVTQLKLREVSCLRYNSYRGVSKCFFKQIDEL